MKITEEIVELLRKKKTSFIETITYSKLPGIYAFFFIGNNFPIVSNKVKKHQIIYIGKTETSQEKRDLKTHFTSGKTGSSTVRKTIGSILCQQENLKPIPRNGSDYSRGKFSHFKFDEKSEEIITKWMIENLALSFYEYPKSKYEIDQLETDLIEYLRPILNISKNPKNEFGNTLRSLRKTCALEAAKDFNKKVTPLKPTLITSKSIRIKNSTGKYIELWEDQKFKIIEILGKGNIGNIPIDPENFAEVGNRKKFSFNLEYQNGHILTIANSAVARDLAKVLENDKEIKGLISPGHYKFSMGKDFILKIKKN